MTTATTPATSAADLARTHAELGVVTRRALDIDVVSATHPAAPESLVESLWREVSDLALDMCDLVLHLGGQLGVGGTLRTTLSLGEKDLRDSFAALRSAMGARREEVVDACRSSRDRVVRLGLALEDQLSGALGLPSDLAATRQWVLASERHREHARVQLARRLEAALASLGSPMSAAHIAGAHLGRAAREMPDNCLHPHEREQVAELNRRCLQLLWVTPRERREAAARRLLPDIAGFAALLFHETRECWADRTYGYGAA